MSIATLTTRWRATRLKENDKDLTGGATPGDQALDELTRYIPTETITLFVASVGIAATLASLAPFITLKALYVFWALATPLVVLLVALGKHKASGATTRPPTPWWPMIAATLAFLAWALAVPGMVENDAGKVLAAFGAVLVSKVLSLFEPIFGK